MNTLSKDKELLELYPVLKSLPKMEIEDALKHSEVMSLKTGAVVFEELQSCKTFPFILTGNVRVIKRSPAGREISLYNVTPGDACVVSSACLLGHKPYNAVGLVEADCELVMMPAEDFDCLLTIRDFREFIFSLFSKRVLDLMQLVDEVAFRKLDQRLARLLMSKGLVIEISHQALADELGTVREMITRTLNSFADSGVVRLRRGCIEIVDRPGLERLSAL